MKKPIIIFLVLIGGFLYWTSNSTSAAAVPRNEKAVLAAINSKVPSANCVFVCPSGLSIYKKVVFLDPRGKKYEVSHRDLWTSEIDFPAGSYAMYLSESRKYKIPTEKPQYFSFRPNSVYTLDGATSMPTLIGYSRSSGATKLPTPSITQRLSTFEE